MTAKEKAQELFDKMCQTITSECPHEPYCNELECKWKGIVFCKMAQNEAKQCASIAVDELILNTNNLIGVAEDEYPVFILGHDFWDKVKKELQSLNPIPPTVDNLKQ